MHRGLKPVDQRRDDALSRISWQELERLLGDHYRVQGYKVEHVGTGGTTSRFDGGIDLKLRKGEEYLIVQCKHWNAFKVTHNAVHELFGVMSSEGATGAILACSGEFTRAAIVAAGKLQGVQLLNGDDVRRICGPQAEPCMVRDAVNPPVDRFSLSVNAEDRILLPPPRLQRPEKPQPRNCGSSRHSRRSLLPVKLVVAVVLFVLLGAWLQRTIKRISPTARAAPAEAGSPAEPSSPTLAPSRVAIPAVASEPDERGSVNGSPQVSRADREWEERQWRRSNAEAMKILEASTPELQRMPRAEDALDVPVR